MPEWINSIIRYFRTWYARDDTVDDMQRILYSPI